MGGMRGDVAKRGEMQRFSLLRKATLRYSVPPSSFIVCLAFR